MKIGIDIRNIGKKRTGDEVVFFNLVKNLALIDSENEYKLFTDTADTTVFQNTVKKLGLENKTNFEIVSLETKNKFTWNFWTLQRSLRKKPVDVYLTQYITPFFVPRKIKIATIIHDISFNFYPQFIRWSDLFFLKTLIPMSLRRARKIIGVSKFTQDEIIKFYKIDESKVDWIHNAVPDEFRNENLSQDKLEAVRKKYNLPEKYILYLGTLQPRKNLPSLIEAMALLKSKSSFKDIKLVLAGGKGHNYDREIDQRIKNYNLSDDVIFPGYINEEDKAAIMKNALVFCFPSFYEGFGIPILEAMAVSTPVVASDILPHREIAEGAASFFNPDVSGELAEKLDEAIFNQVIRSNLISSGKIQSGKFSWQSSARKLIDILAKI